MNDNDTDNLRVYGGYIRGYSKAIVNIQEMIEYINNDLKYHHKRLNYKYLQKLLSCWLTNRHEYLDNSLNGGDGFIRYNHKADDFEWFNRKEVDN